MRPALWQPPVAPSAAEQAIIKRIRRAKLFVFLQVHHELFSEAFLVELATLYQESPLGQPPIPPTQLALATTLQAYTGVSDDEVIEATTMDRCWQLVLDCLDCSEPPFSKGTLGAFPQRLIVHQMDRRLIEQTIVLATHKESFGSRQLGLPSLVPRCGERAGSRIPTISWVTPCAGTGRDCASAGAGAGGYRNGGWSQPRRWLQLESSTRLGLSDEEDILMGFQKRPLCQFQHASWARQARARSQTPPGASHRERPQL